ncbi:molybdopterin molybdotransferase MoeA [Candidatus Venteria ishoeyi]|uniref:Molybdopterin molybdenumtransferase n=1 Tax=Candidatus Venteria ishoeyi TaxID=1899563 RepID=A0A1H6FCT1_9GAMM|nr:gephyrin-like molybdotransferase Glp [Candidatus Venteria ishoeyi]MDM8545723.1 molybdopterin molybdotransferase MoeA [Candidatus Venteria ishoeyi]SEH06844.1 Molybdopterin molybdenumtransferase [Candidatus Venteria ishoeyi]
MSNDCCGGSHKKMLLLEQARQRIHDSIQPVSGVEQLPVRDALHRVLAADVHSNLNVPAYDNSAMDGYAIQGSDIPANGTIRLEMIATSWAGKPWSGTMQAGQTVRIMTGGKIPQGADTVIMQEDVETDEQFIQIGHQHKPGQHLRKAGEDIAKDAVVLPAGRRLLPADLGLLASVGATQISVRRKLRVAFFSTGDELCSIGEHLDDGQIYDSNRYTLYGMLKRLDVEMIDMGVIRDQRDLIRQAFQEASSIADVLITSGGVSVGEADFVKDTLEEMGQVDFWKVAIKPGKPLAFGKVQQALFFGLPGNPVSAMATFYLFVQPALKWAMGQTEVFVPRLKVKAAEKFKKHPGRLDFQRGILRMEDGEAKVYSTGGQGSGILTSMSRANCFIVLPLESTGVEAGEWVEVEPFEGLL